MRAEVSCFESIILIVDPETSDFDLSQDAMTRGDLTYNALKPLRPFGVSGLCGAYRSFGSSGTKP